MTDKNVKIKEKVMSLSFIILHCSSTLLGMMSLSNHHFTF